MSASVKLVGVGNRYRGDDGVGLVVIDSLASRLPASMLKTSDGEITALIECFESNEQVVIIDAIDDTGQRASPGCIVRIDALEQSLQDTSLRSSSHAVGVGEAVEMARVLNKLPDKLSVIGVVGMDFSNKEGLTESVQLAAESVAMQLEQEFKHSPNTFKER